MKILFCLFLLFAAFIPARADEPHRTSCEYQPDPSEQTKLLSRGRASLDFVVFPEVSLSKASFPDAIAWLQQHNREHTPASILADIGGIDFTIFPRQGTKEEEKKFDVSLRSATLPQVLNAICTQHHYVWCLKPYALIVMPRERLTAPSGH